MILKNPDNSAANYSRINIQALDFDWIFEEDNAETFLEILTDLDSSSIYSRKSIQIMI